MDALQGIGDHHRWYILVPDGAVEIDLTQIQSCRILAQSSRSMVEQLRLTIETDVGCTRQRRLVDTVHYRPGQMAGADSQFQ